MIALALLLVGCMAVILGLQERKIGAVSHTEYLDDAGQWVKPTEVTRDVITMYGYQGSANYLATKEWYAFLEQYDPNYELMTDSNEQGIPDNYYNSYNCYTWDMVAKLEEITQKYGLTPMGTMAVAQRWDTELFFDALGLEGLCHEDAQAEIIYGSGYFYPEGAFNLSVDLKLNGEDASWTDTIWSTVHYSPKAYFDPKITTINSGSYEEWNYTTADGSQVLIAMSNWGAFIFAEQKDAYITISINTDIDFLSSSASEKHPSREDLEQIADVYDFTIQPHPPENMEELRKQLEASAEEWNRQQETASHGPDYSAYHDYSDFLADYNPWLENSYYVLYDLNGDGVEDLVLGDNSDSFDQVMTTVDGEIVEFLFAQGAHLYENHIIGIVSPTGYSSYIRSYYSLDGYKTAEDEMTMLEYVGHDFIDGTWKHGTSSHSETTISQMEAQQIEDSYSRIDLELKPVVEYPVDGNGMTLYEAALERTKKLTEADIMEAYSRAVKDDQEKSNVPSNFYCLYDLNHDGIDELLLASERDYFTDAFTIYNGKLTTIQYWSHMNLCADQILEFSGKTPHSESHSYYRYSSKGLEFVEEVRFSAYDARWYYSTGITNDTTREITEEEYNDILYSHPRVELDMKPIQEFPMQ